jgi:hypothetical protein
MIGNYNLFLDDDPKRIPGNLAWIQHPDVEWVIVRNYKDFIKTIRDNGIPKIVSFDHDLGEEHYMEYHRVKNTDFSEKIDYSRFKEKTGYDCAKWLAEYCVDKKTPIPLYYIHTLNGPGGANIFSIMESARKVINNELSSSM